MRVVDTQVEKVDFVKIIKLSKSKKLGVGSIFKSRQVFPHLLEPTMRHFNEFGRFLLLLNFILFSKMHKKIIHLYIWKTGYLIYYWLF